MQWLESIVETLAGTGSNVGSRLSLQWLGLAVWQYVAAFILVTISFFARRIMHVVVTRLVFPRLDGRRMQPIRQTLNTLLQPFSAVIGLTGLYAAVRVIIMSPDGTETTGLITTEFVTQMYEIAATVVAIWALLRLIDVLAGSLRERAQDEELPIDVPVISLLQKSLKVFVGILGVVFVLQHAGYPIAGILGGLGIGGLAIALAAQDTLSNLFGSIIIFADKPFKVGDWVIVGDVEGFVETIGFRSTKIRTWPRSLVTVPNKVIADTSITNWSAMPVRRVYFNLPIAYDATSDQVEAVTGAIYRIIENHPGIDKGFYAVHFTEFGPAGLEIMVYYFTRSVVWIEHMKVKEEVNLAIMRAVEKAELSIGKPGRDIYVVEKGHGTMPHLHDRQ